MCEPGYLETQIIDDDGNERLVCLKSFCGIEGYGDTCTTIPTTSSVKNCQRMKKIAYDDSTTLSDCQ